MEDDGIDASGPAKEGASNESASSAPKTENEAADKASDIGKSGPVAKPESSSDLQLDAALDNDDSDSSGCEEVLAGTDEILFSYIPAGLKRNRIRRWIWQSRVDARDAVLRRAVGPESAVDAGTGSAPISYAASISKGKASEAGAAPMTDDEVPSKGNGSSGAASAGTASSLLMGMDRASRTSAIDTPTDK